MSWFSHGKSQAEAGRGAVGVAKRPKDTMTTEQKTIRAKVGLLELAKQLGNVSQACKMMGYSRDRFYRFKELYEAGAQEPGATRDRGRQIVRPRAARHLAKSAYAQRIRRRGLMVSRASVRCVWQRHDLETMNKRLQALEARSGQDGLVLTEAQLAALEKARPRRRPSCGAQDTFYVGNLKGVGRVYQQTFINTYAKTSPSV